jgi:hypothetical protein
VVAATLAPRADLARRPWRAGTPALARDARPSLRAPDGWPPPPAATPRGRRYAVCVSTTALRNVAIVLVLGAIVYFVPGGGNAASLIGALFSTAILAAFVMFAVRFYRQRRTDILTLDDRWRGVLYGSLGVIVLAMAARPRLIQTGGGLIVWLAAVAASAYGLYRVWRHWREYG